MHRQTILDNVRSRVSALVRGALVIFLTVAPSGGTPIPVISLSKVVSDSGFIVVGRITELTAAGR